MQKTILTITFALLTFGLAGCNEEKPVTQAQEPEQTQQAKDINEAIGKSTAAPSSTPSQRKYKY